MPYGVSGFSVHFSWQYPESGLGLPSRRPNANALHASRSLLLNHLTHMLFDGAGFLPEMSESPVSIH